MKRFSLFLLVLMISGGSCYADETSAYSERGRIEETVKKSDANTFERMKAQAEQGDLKAEIWMAEFYRLKGIKDLEGPDTGTYESDFKKEDKWDLKAAEQGDMVSQFFTGLSFFQSTDGKDTVNSARKKMAEAAFWWRKAAEQGDRNAQYKLGNLWVLEASLSEGSQSSKKHLYENFNDHFENRLQSTNHILSGAETVKWMKASAEQGCAESQYWLAAIYNDSKDRTIPHDYSEAYYWWSILLASNKKEIESYKVIDGYLLITVLQMKLTEVMHKLTADQILLMDKRVKAWKPPTNPIAACEPNIFYW